MRWRAFKRSRLIRKMYGKFISFLGAYFPSMGAKIKYRIAYGEKCDLNNPKTFSEKLLWLSLNTYRNNPLILKLSDKYLVRDYIAQQGLSDILSGLYHVWEDPKEIDFGKLPKSFVLKLSQGCGTNILCADKDLLDEIMVCSTLGKWKSGQFLYDKRMANVGGLTVRELKKYYLCEEYLNPNGDGGLVDYKIYCFNGVPKAILVISGRFSEINGVFMTPDWAFLSELKGKYKVPDKPFPRPKSLDRMIEVARKLSEPFPFVRVDMYDVSGEAIFGELTFFPNGCVKMQETEINGKTMGELLDITYVKHY